jgi:hypothetical protein
VLVSFHKRHSIKKREKEYAAAITTTLSERKLITETGKKWYASLRNVQSLESSANVCKLYLKCFFASFCFSHFFFAICVLLFIIINKCKAYLRVHGTFSPITAIIDCHKSIIRLLLLNLCNVSSEWDNAMRE